MTKLILWVDDDRELLRHQHAFIERQGYSVHIEADADKAIAFIEKQRQGVTGIILDVMMSPGHTLRGRDHRNGLITGLVLLEYLLERRLVSPATFPRCFIFTHRLDPVAEQRTEALGFKYYLKQDYLGSRITRLIAEQFEPGEAQD